MGSFVLLLLLYVVSIISATADADEYHHYDHHPPYYHHNESSYQQQYPEPLYWMNSTAYCPTGKYHWAKKCDYTLVLPAVITLGRPIQEWHHLLNIIFQMYL
jgi:hypothetical protein